MAGYVFQLGDTMGYNRKIQDRKRGKSAAQRALERELIDKRYHARRVASIRGRSREWRYIPEETEDDESSALD